MNPNTPPAPIAQQFQIELLTTDGNFNIAASQTVNDLVRQAKYWLNITDRGMKLRDDQIRTVTLQELDPDTGNYVNGASLPVASKKQVLIAIHKLGAR